MKLPGLRPLVGARGARIAGGWARAREIEDLVTAAIRPLDPAADAAYLARPAPLMGFDWRRPLIMAILNVTPDSFSDGGLYADRGAAVAQARRMLDEGADILDIGGESTRPGAAVVPQDEEIARVVPVIAALRAAGIAAPISIDTRKSGVARAAIDAGASMVNDVSALAYDRDMAAVVAAARVPICLMHAQGTPETMQIAPRYGDVTRDVIAALAERIAIAQAAGIERSRILIDPGIGFGKTMAHNLDLLRRLTALHGFGLPVVLGASRKRFIGVLSGGDGPEVPPGERLPGSIAVALLGVAQGMQIVRVHDSLATKQALNLSMALGEAADDGAGKSGRLE